MKEIDPNVTTLMDRADSLSNKIRAMQQESMQDMAPGMGNPPPGQDDGGPKEGGGE